MPVPKKVYEKILRLDRTPRLTRSPKFFLHVYENEYTPTTNSNDKYKLVVTNSGISGRGVKIHELDVCEQFLTNRMTHLIRLFGICNGHIVPHINMSKS